MRTRKDQTDPPEKKAGLFARFWRSVIRGPVFPRDDRDRRRIVLSHLILHMRPARMRPQTLRYTLTWGLGGTCLVLFTLLALTGVLMVFVYVPSPERAYQSVTALERDVLFGQLVRNIHHWSANFLVAVAVLHLLRVFLTGAFRGARQFNWIIGLLLLLGVLAANFTGYLLPWDQLSYWAITICTGMLSYVPGIGGVAGGRARRSGDRAQHADAVLCDPHDLRTGLPDTVHGLAFLACPQGGWRGNPPGPGKPGV